MVRYFIMKKKKQKKTNNKLDLHNTKHSETRQEIITIIEKYWDTSTELQIITGHSNAMKEEVITVLKEYKLSYTIGDRLGLNKGYITVTVQKEKYWTTKDWEKILLNYEDTIIVAGKKRQLGIRTLSSNVVEVYKKPL